MQRNVWGLESLDVREGATRVMDSVCLFNGGRLKRQLVATAHALRPRQARRKADERAETLLDDHPFRNLLAEMYKLLT